MFSKSEKTDLILIYEEFRKNASAAARLCKQIYPSRHPIDTVFT